MLTQQVDFRYPDKPTTATTEFLQFVNEKEFACQSKINGWRVLVYAESDISLYTRMNLTLQQALKEEVDQELIDELLKLKSDKLTIFDGEFTGRRDFKKQTIILFDLMMFNGEWITDWTFRERFTLLNTLVCSKIERDDLVSIVETVDRGFTGFYNHLHNLALAGDQQTEGVVLKRWDSLLIGNRKKSIDNPDWFKAKWA